MTHPKHSDFLTDPEYERLPQAVIAKARFNQQAYDPSLYDSLNVMRHDRFDRAVPKRQADFLAGRLVAQAALGNWGLGNQQIPSGADRAPLWPDGFNGSITHTSQTCAAIVTRDDMICGIDHELVAGGSALEAIMDRCLLPQDKHWVENQTQYRSDVMATLAFGAKECIYKALAPTVKQFFGFECAQIIGWSNGGKLTVRLTQTLHGLFPEGTVFGIRCAVDGQVAQTMLLTPRPV